MKGKFKSWYIFILISTFFVFLACSKKTEVPTKVAVETFVKSQNVNKLRIMGHWYGEGKKELLVRELVREFSLLNQDLDIELEFPHQIFKFDDEAELYFIECDSIQGMVEKNSWPFDVLFCDQERYKKVGQQINDMQWGKKYLTDFSQEPWFKAAHKDGLFETINFAEKYGGTLPGPIIEGIVNILFVSEDVEQKVGIKVKDFDMTYDDFLSYAKAIYVYNKNTSDKISFFSRQYQFAIDNLFKQLTMSALGKSVVTSYQEAFDALSDAYEAFEQLAKYDPLVQYVNYSNLQVDVAQRKLYEKKFLFNIEPSWMILLWNKLNPDGLKKMRPCEIPSFTGKASPYYSGFFQVIFVVPKNCANPEAGKRFIKFITSNETADKWVKYSKCPTGLKNTISYTDFGQDKYEKYFRHLQKKYGNNQVDVNLANLLFNTNANIDFHYTEVLEGKISASEALRLLKMQIR